MQGILVVNKDSGFTSHDVVNISRKAFGIKKIGHTGTLDPMATGVLPLCIGKATKIASYIQSACKTYTGTMQFGIETDTLDAEGSVTEVSEIIPSKEDLDKSVAKFIGEVEQIPPMYSAVKQNGKKLYELARIGKIVDRPPRKITIFSFEIISYEEQLGIASFKVSCSSGTYIRSLCKDLANDLFTVGHLTSLNRVQVGNFQIKDSVTIQFLKKASKDELFSKIMPMDSALEQIPFLNISEDNFNKVINGIKVEVSKNDISGICRVYFDTLFIGLGEVYHINNKNMLHVKKLLLK